MNGNGRLYRSTSEAMLGGVAAGLGNYFKIDPTFLRLAFLLLTVFSGGAFVLVYLVAWLLIPTAGSTATEANQIIHENVNEIGDRVRGFMGGTGNNPNVAGTQGTQGPGGNPGGNPGATYNQTQLPQGSQGQAGPAVRPRQGIGGGGVLILIGTLFLLANLGFFRWFHLVHWGVLWPLLFIVLGVIILSRRSYK